ncbi:hypothetical protein [Xenorhabdus koppenhoeferi]|uniref:hypothetical protein n=1 Tax=Xenorhabdus koppenhoeferi TaxID=351659 RepID=UPI000B82B27D|nr:hypothetical protein [Xenorhabdus koppenhoeferi]
MRINQIPLSKPALLGSGIGKSSAFCDYRLILIPDPLDNRSPQISSLFFYLKSQTIAQVNA